MDKDSVLNMIRSTVRAVEPDAEIILYGSRARRDARPESDWDTIVILNKSPMPHQERYEIAYELWVKGENLTNHHYQDIGNVPQPGIWIMSGVRVKLNI